MKEKFKQFITQLNNNGIPLPVLQDCKTKQPSITYTFFVVSGLIVVLGLIGKASKLLDIDLQQLMQSIYWFMSCGGLYMGRKFQKIGDQVQLLTDKETNDTN